MNFAQPIKASVTWAQLSLPREPLRQLQEIARSFPRHGGITALFAGPGGTGKTMAAAALATRLNMPLYRIDLARVVSKYIGETEKNLDRIFRTAAKKDWILFFDEADALFGRRTNVKDSHDRHANTELSYLLERLEDNDGLAILATNRKSVVDSSFLRRFRFVVVFPGPEPSRRQSK